MKKGRIRVLGGTRKEGLREEALRIQWFCIELHVEKSTEKEVTDSEEDDEDEEDEEGIKGNEQKIDEVHVQKEKEEKRKRRKSKRFPASGGNSTKTKPLCMRKSFSDDWENHLSVKHLSVEGQLEFRALSFVPRRAPFQLSGTMKQRNNIKLYVRRVFTTDDCDEAHSRVVEFCQKRRGFGGSSSAHFAGDAAAEDLARDHGKACEEALWHVHRLFRQER